MQLPRLQEKWEEAVVRVPEQQQAVADLLADVVALLRQQQAALQAAHSSGGGGAFPTRQMHWLLATAAGYSQAALSKADVAAIFLSRRLLADPLANPDLVSVGEGKAARQLQAAISATLFVAAVEAAWQAHGRLMRGAPKMLRRAGAPVSVGLRVARVAVWSAALVLSATHIRAACSSVGASAADVLGSIRLPAVMHSRWWGRTASGAAPGGGDGEDVGQPDESGDGLAADGPASTL